MGAGRSRWPMGATDRLQASEANELRGLQRVRGADRSLPPVTWAGRRGGRIGPAPVVPSGQNIRASWQSGALMKLRRGRMLNELENQTIARAGGECVRQMSGARLRPAAGRNLTNCPAGRLTD